MRGSWWVEIGIALLALVIRGLYVGELRGSILFEPQGDALLHYELARELAAGDWWGDRVYYYAPLYPYFVAVLFALVGPSLLLVAVTQVLLSAADVCVVMAISRRLFGPGVSRFAGLLAATYGPFVFYTGFLLKETLGLILLDSFVLLALYVDRPRGWALGFLAGLLFALAVLVRPNLLPLAVLVVCWLVFVLRDAGLWRRAGVPILFAVGALAGLVPVAARNYAVAGEWVLISAHGGHNFFMGNRLGATGLYEPLVLGGGQSPYEEEQDARRLAEQATGRSLTASQVSDYWYARGWQDIRRHPGNFVRVTLRKAALFWNDYEVPDFQDFYFLREQCSTLWLAPISFGLIAPFAVVGLYASARQWRDCLILYCMIGGIFATVLPFFVFARYRLPVTPFVLVFSAYGVWRLASWLKRGEWPILRIPVAIAFVTALLVNWRLHDAYDLRAFAATSYFNLGNLHNAAGELDESIAAWEQAVRLSPGYRKAQRALGAAYFLRGRFADSARALEQSAVWTFPGFSADADAVYMLSVSYAKVGEAEAAAELVAIGRSLWPGDSRFDRAEGIRNDESGPSAAPADTKVLDDK